MSPGCLVTPWFGRAYVLGVEPQSSMPGAHDTGGRLLALGPGEKIDTALSFVFYEGGRPVTSPGTPA